MLLLISVKVGREKQMFLTAYKANNIVKLLSIVSMVFQIIEIKSYLICVR